MLSKIINFIRARLRKQFLEEYWLEDYIRLGMKIGKNCSLQPGLIVDVSHCWLIEIKDNVILAPHVYLLAHDTSTQRFVGYTKIGRIVIHNNVFVGARTTIMPGVTIGENSIIGANSLVTSSIPENVVAAGNPAKVICSIKEYEQKIKIQFNNASIFSSQYTLRENIDEQMKEEMNQLLKEQVGFVK